MLWWEVAPSPTTREIAYKATKKGRPASEKATIHRHRFPRHRLFQETERGGREDRPSGALPSRHLTRRYDYATALRDEFIIAYIGEARSGALPHLPVFTHRACSLILERDGGDGGGGGAKQQR